MSGLIAEKSRFPVVPYQFYACTGSGHTPSRSVDEYWENCTIPWVTTGDVKHLRDGRRHVIDDTEFHISELGMANSAARLHPAGTVVLSRTASVGFSAIMGQRMATSQDFFTWTPSRQLESRYLLWVLRAMKECGDFDRLMFGSTHKTIYVPDLQRLRGPLPPLELQRRIADFLDAATARIDTLIDKNLDLQELIESKRQELVADAVTRGIDDAPIKKSGLGWAPKIAKSYVVGPYSLYGKTGSGHTPRRSNDAYWQDPNIPWVTTSEVAPLRNGRIERIDSTVHQISELGLVNSAATLHAEETVFLSRTASVGFAGIMGRPMATSQDFFTWTCDDRLSPSYLLWVLRAMKWRGEFDRLQYGSTHKTIYVPDLMMLSGPVPPRAEQERIVAYIRERIEPAHRLIDSVQKEMKFMRERRQAFIAAAVTGQLEA